MPVDPDKVKAHKYILFTEVAPEVEIKNTFYTQAENDSFRSMNVTLVSLYIILYLSERS